MHFKVDPSWPSVQFLINQLLVLKLLSLSLNFFGQGIWGKYIESSIILIFSVLCPQVRVLRKMLMWYWSCWYGSLSVLGPPLEVMGETVCSLPWKKPSGSLRTPLWTDPVPSTSPTEHCQYQKCVSQSHIRLRIKISMCTAVQLFSKLQDYKRQLVFSPYFVF